MTCTDGHKCWLPCGNDCSGQGHSRPTAFRWQGRLWRWGVGRPFRPLILAAGITPTASPAFLRAGSAFRCGPHFSGRSRFSAFDPFRFADCGFREPERADTCGPRRPAEGLSLAVPAAWAVPNFGGASIVPIVFATSPGSSCQVTLPPATGGDISYAIANHLVSRSMHEGSSPALLRRSRPSARTSTWLRTHADNRTASLTFTRRWTRRPFADLLQRDRWWTSGWANLALPTTCLEDLEGVNLHRFDHLGTVGRVSSLVLSDNNLTGRLPAELGKLTNLTEIHRTTN